MKVKTLTLILAMCCGLTAINTTRISAQQKSDSAPIPITSATPPVSELDECSRLLDKSISEKQSCVESKRSLEAQVVAKDDLINAQKKTIADQDALNKLISNPPKKCFGISLGKICVGFKY